MSVKIRMKRLGANKSPYYRIVVADSRRARNGRFIEELGYYNPISEPRMFSVNADRAKEWIRVGATPSTTVSRLFKEYKVEDSTGVIAFGREADQLRKSLEAEAKEKEAAAEREAENEARKAEKDAREAAEAEAEEVEAEEAETEEEAEPETEEAGVEEEEETDEEEKEAEPEAEEASEE